MNFFPRNDARGAEITPEDDARNDSLLIGAAIERELFGKRPPDDPPPLMSIRRERDRLAAKRKTDNWERNHP